MKKEEEEDEDEDEDEEEGKNPEEVWEEGLTEAQEEEAR